MILRTRVVLLLEGLPKSIVKDSFNNYFRHNMNLGIRKIFTIILILITVSLKAQEPHNTKRGGKANWYVSGIASPPDSTVISKDSLAYLGIFKINPSEFEASISVGQKIKVKYNSDYDTTVDYDPNRYKTIKGELIGISDSTIKIWTKQKKKDDSISAEFIAETICIDSITKIYIESLSKSKRITGGIMHVGGTVIAIPSGGMLLVGGLLFLKGGSSVIDGIALSFIGGSLGTVGLILRRLGITTKYNIYEIDSTRCLKHVME